METDPDQMPYTGDDEEGDDVQDSGDIPGAAIYPLSEQLLLR